MSKTKWLEAVAGARAQVAPQWTDDRARAVERAMVLRRRRRARARVVLAVAAMAVVTATGWAVSRRGAGGLNGIHVTPLDASSRVELVSADDQTAGMAVSAGGAWFDVAPRAKDARFFVRAGDVEVEVVGTRFLVERVGDGARVRVDHGQVHVRWPGGEVELRGGEARQFDGPARAEASVPPSTPDALPASAVAAAPPPAATPVPTPPEALPAGSVAVAPSPSERPAPTAAPARLVTLPPAPEVTAAPSAPVAPEAAAKAPDIAPWRRLADEGAYDQAWQAMQSAATPPRDEPAELMVAADIARLTHHLPEAMGLLRSVSERHVKDPRAPLAAFTLGRLLLENLGQPRQAAEAFARVRVLAPDSVLSEDALAREVEARSRAGETLQAHALAQEYAERYPQGQRLRAVRYHGGLE